MCIDATCPHRKLIEQMPFPFAVFDRGRDGLILTQYNFRFKQVFDDVSVGDSIGSFPFEDGEVKVKKEWFKLVSYNVGRSVVVVMIDITSRKKVDDSMAELLNTVADII